MIARSSAPAEPSHLINAEYDPTARKQIQSLLGEPGCGLSQDRFRCGDCGGLSQDSNRCGDCCIEEADVNEASCFDDFRKGGMQEEELRETLDYYAEVRVLRGLRPSKIREINIEKARLEASSNKKGKGKDKRGAGGKGPKRPKG